MRKQKKRTPLRRFLRIVRWAILLCLVFSLVATYAPFVNLPDLDAETASTLDTRAMEMFEDRATDDRAMIIESSKDALYERLRLIEQSEREIVIVTYENHDGESTRDILAAALHKADQGVKVRFLVDGIAGRFDHMGGDLFRAVAAHDNVEVRFYNLIRFWTPWKHMGRMHDKYVIVDDGAFILGGRNMFDKFLGEYTATNRSLDREVLICGTDCIKQLRAYFEGMWEHPETSAFRPWHQISEERCQVVYDALAERYEGLRADMPELFTPCDYAEKTLPTRGVWLVSNPTGIYAKEPVVFGQLTAMMARAKEDVVIHSPYAVLNRAMRDALRTVAEKVPVTLMINAVENGANLVGSGDYLYHRREVLSTGVRLLEYAGGKSYHGKAVAIDDQLSVIGSFNLDLRSTYLDTELMLVIRSPEINAELRGYMDALHADCREVLDADNAVVPKALAIPECPGWKRALLYVIGALMQPVRNLV
ncbi:MAG: phospholipase D family protein [Clostridia bacterium]|nr:phospholipase D family protein [Clostridia bacterium]